MSDAGIGQRARYTAGTGGLQMKRASASSPRRARGPLMHPALETLLGSDMVTAVILAALAFDLAGMPADASSTFHLKRGRRSEERRVGKECRARCAPYHEKKKIMTRRYTEE